MNDQLVDGRWTPRGPIVDEHIFSYYGCADPMFTRGGELGITVKCSCGAVHHLEPGKTDTQMIRLKCHEVNIS
jgi:hypothetical protein